LRGFGIEAATARAGETAAAIYKELPTMMTREQAKAFAGEWLPAWSGNNPELLASFYADDCFYLDPGIPQGVRGKEALLAYFRKLLSANPEWVWTQREAIPMEGGFVNLWHASIPVGENKLECDGLCFVVMDNTGKITRNEVYFDRSKLIKLIVDTKKMNTNINRRIGVIVIDHGSRSDTANSMLLRLTKHYKEHSGIQIVEPAHMELAEPTLVQAFGKCVEQGATHIIISQFFLSPGRHSKKDIPDMARAAAWAHDGVTFSVTEPLGVDELMLKLLHKRVEECLREL